MKFNTALCFILSAGALFGMALGRWKKAAIVLAGLGFALASASLMQYWIGHSLGIDEFVVHDRHTPLAEDPGRMSPGTALSFILIDTALILLVTGKSKLVVPGQALAMGSLFGGMIGLTGYILAASSLYKFFWFSSMAVHTSLLFVMLGVATLLASWDKGFVATVTSKKMGGRLARRLIPVAVVLPIIVGWLLLAGARAGYYDPVMIVDLFAIITIITFGVSIWLQAASLNRAHTDLMEQNRLLAKAGNTDALLAAIVESSDAAIVSESADGTITSWNAAAERMYGYTAQEMIGQTMARLIPHDAFADEADVIQNIRRGARNGHFEAKRQHKDGSLLDVSVMVSSVLDDRGKRIGISRIARNISEQKRMEEDLQESLREIQNLKAALDEHAIVAITDPKGKITYVNDKFCAISQYAREELIGQDHRMLNSAFHSKDFMRELWATITQGKIWHGKIRNRAKDGHFYWVDTTIVPFMGADGRPQKYVAVRSDITESMQVAETLARQAARLARSNKDLEQFAYIASHDLQEPLRAVSGCAQLLKKRYEGKLDAKADEFIHHTVEGAERMQRLIRDLLAFSRVGTRGEEMQKINLEQPLKTAMENLAVLIKECDATITCDPLPEIHGDSGQLTMLMQNLIGNAIKFRGERRPEVHIGAVKEGDAWTVSVRDNGIGIEADYFERIFIIFQRLHTRDEYSGTGIGLALCKRIVERHGGNIWVESTPGQGSVFSFTLRDDAQSS
ncbi:PAS domain S-box protein [Ruficoccus amylovorans]|uniref:histidine kinase n=1 Tax=Ruficoccus amylovorans TaxID=1804625 RepID=A0A842HBQ9_9BACT|nr:PAS domain S-box protein [Ruficoccus amylovorans]MBC2593599.1 PAS domain S-box protein [Ruficoccus amylovorans]